MLGPPLDAAAIHAWFSNLAGAEHIATQHAISGLVRWLHRVRPSRVLEIGPGIGTLSYTVLRWAEGAGVPIELTCVEQDAFCRSALIENLGDFRPGPRVVSSFEEATLPDGGFSMVLVDGGTKDPRYFASLARRAVVFVEGGRESQRALVEAAHPGRPRARACFFSLRRRLAGRKSAYWVYQFEPRAGERLWFWLARLRDGVGYRLKSVVGWFRQGRGGADGAVG